MVGQYKKEMKFILGEQLGVTYNKKNWALGVLRATPFNFNLHDWDGANRCFTFSVIVLIISLASEAAASASELLVSLWGFSKEATMPQSSQQKDWDFLANRRLSETGRWFVSHIQWKLRHAREPSMIINTCKRPHSYKFFTYPLHVKLFCFQTSKAFFWGN